MKWKSDKSIIAIKVRYRAFRWRLLMRRCCARQQNLPVGIRQTQGESSTREEEKREITECLYTSESNDKRFRQRREIGLPVSGSPPARIYHASTNLASTSSILGHLGSTGNYNIGLLDESLRLRPKGVVLGTLTRAKASGSARRCPTCLENMSHLLRAISHLSRGFV